MPTSHPFKIGMLNPSPWLFVKHQEMRKPKLVGMLMKDVH